MAKHLAATRRALPTAARRALVATAIAGVASGVILPGAEAAPLKSTRPTWATAAPAAPAATDKGQAIVNTARQYKGIAYRWGGTTPAGFDCSGFTQYVFRKHGVNLPRTSSAQSGVGRRVPASQARPGDLMWKPGHVGIYTGNGRMIHSPRTGDVIKEVNVYSSSFQYIRVA